MQLEQYSILRYPTESMNSLPKSSPIFNYDASAKCHTRLFCCAAIAISWFQIWSMKHVSKMFHALFPDGSYGATDLTILTLNAMGWLHIICVIGTVALLVTEGFVKSAHAKNFAYVAYMLAWTIVESIAIYSFCLPIYNR